MQEKTNNPLKKKRLKTARFICLIAAVFAAAVFMISYALKENFVFFVTPSEVQAKDIKPGQLFRLGGLVEKGSVISSELDGKPVYNFKVTDKAVSIPVEYKGILPDLFREEQGVVAEGRFSNDKQRMIADKVLAKHDEKYMPKEVADKLKDQGLWQPEEVK